MADDRYYVVSERVIPEIFLKVLKVNELLYTGEVKDITEGIRQVGISRSAYYKYKDHVFPMSESINSKKITLAVSMSHEAGVLSKVLDKIAEMKGNVLTINQDIPMNMIANATITLDIAGLEIDVKALIKQIDTLKGVIKVKLFAME
ncbi:ACT domain-containing protein [Clostridium manihotivorum]|uniref:UPF0735 ACT domain-containing protein C1I91_02755 n=1 Tax=Clostridium manihotivorum TaxID=2320868 RepID=A0A3R5QVP3_9CLOT|nr:ACT domain-containing protein [Clostridium manihotivorum]QAA30672.1 hypothetical protein C1I91_02755 [Clostridium manihotivorum]